MSTTENTRSSIRAVVHAGRIEPLEPIELPEGTQVIVLCLGEDESAFWKQASATSVEAVWGNAADDVYAELLQG